MNKFEIGKELELLLENNLIIENELEIELFNQFEIMKLLKDVEYQINQSSNLILNSDLLSIIKSNLKFYNHLNNDHIKLLTNCIVNGMEQEMIATSESISENIQENFENHCYILSHYVFLWYWMFDTMENMPKEKKKDSCWFPAPKSTKEIGVRGTFLKSIQQFISLNLNALFLSSAERDLVINDMIFKCVRLCMEDADVVKNTVVKSCIIDIFAQCATKYPSSFKVLSNYMQDFLREESLCECVADILDVCITTFNHSTSVEVMLKTIGGKQYSDKDQDKLSKATSKFLLKFAELQPKEVMKQMVHLNDLLDSESATIRAVMMDVITIIIQNYLCNSTLNTADTTTTNTNLQSFYSILSQRLLDISALVRSRVLKLLIKLTQRNPLSPATCCIPLHLRASLVHGSILRLRDKSSIVRKKAVELLSSFLETHPFIGVAADLGAVSEKRFQERVAELEGKRKSLIDNWKKEKKNLLNKEKQVDENGHEMNLTDKQDDDEEEELPEELQQELFQTEPLLKYYQDALLFAKMLNQACPIVCDLLESSLKTEVVGALKFFVVAHRFEVEGAMTGVCNMVHKIWDKGTDEEGSNSVRDVLLQSFFDIHLNPPVSSPPPPAEQTALQIAHHLTDLVGRMNLAQQTSLEEVISIMASQDRLPKHVSSSLWSLITTKSTAVSFERKKYAMMVLGMIGKSKKEVIGDHLDILTKFGLGSLVKENDFGVAKYACIAILQYYHVKRQKGVYMESMERKTSDHPTCQRISELLLQKSFDWFSFAEQGLNALYVMTEQPDRICGDIIKKLSDRVFGGKVEEMGLETLTKGIGKLGLESEIDLDGDQDMAVSEARLEETNDDHQENSCGNSSSAAFKLAQLVFVVGHVAIKQIVHLESIESEWKRRKAAKDAGTTGGSLQAGELEMVTGSAEDEFAETIAMVRERELLFGSNSLLSLYGPLLVHILTHNQKFKDPMLQIMASISLCKFMCISSDFCEAHLQLLFAIMERAADPVMRSNLIIGMGDLAICFNSIIDEHIVNLYNRLKDDDFFVKKNTLMVLTFLILNGMIKVKGQISEMAKCVEDSDERIRNISKAFFKELSTKDNAIYNNLPDIISNLSTVEEEQYKSIVKFLFKFIVKEKQNESIVEKLCMRFKHADTERQWRDIGFCLSLLSFGTEKSLKKLADHFSLYQDKLYEPCLFKYLSDIITKVSKGKNEIKSLADDFKERLAKAQVKAIEDHEAALEAQKGLGKGAVAAFKEWKEGVSNETHRLSLPLPVSSGPVPIDETENMAEEEDQLEKRGFDSFPSEVIAKDSTEKRVVEKDDSDATITDSEEVRAIVAPRKAIATPKKVASKAKSKKKAAPVPSRRTGRRAAVMVESAEESD